ncbi:MAG: hypothetical protein ABW189_01495 [Rickettsiales bacterium]
MSDLSREFSERFSPLEREAYYKAARRYPASGVALAGFMILCADGRDPAEAAEDVAREFLGQGMAGQGFTLSESAAMAITEYRLQLWDLHTKQTGAAIWGAMRRQGAAPAQGAIMVFEGECGHA